MTVYRLIMPARALEWGDALLQALFYSTINFIVLLPLIVWAAGDSANGASPVLFWFAAILVLIAFPVVWPVSLRALFKWKWLSSKIQVPYPTAWDYFFDFREPVFVLVHLNNGARIGGYWGPKSYAGSFPNDGDIYVEAVYRIDEMGKFAEPIPDTRGMLLRRTEYSYVELFTVPTKSTG
jgi:uncharacterized protein DUF6338